MTTEVHSYLNKVVKHLRAAQKRRAAWPGLKKWERELLNEALWLLKLNEVNQPDTPAQEVE